MKDTTHVAVGVIGQTGSVPAVEPGVPPDGTGAITPEHIPTATANNGPAGEVTSPRESQPSTIGSNEEPATFNLRPAADPVCPTATPRAKRAVGPSTHNPQPSTCFPP